MANSADMVWVVHPSRMANALDKYGDRAWDAIEALADFIAVKLQNEARQDAPWQDRTGNARSGLVGDTISDFAHKIVEIYLIHSVDYGVFLELARAGRYAIIAPTIERNLPEIKRMLDDLLK